MACQLSPHMNALTGCVISLHEGIVSVHEHATTGRAAKEGLWQWLDPAVRDASHVTHI